MPDRTGRLSAGECLDPEVLSAYIDGTLDVRERANVEAHLASCADCYDVMSEVLRIQEAIPAARPASSTSSAWGTAGAVPALSSTPPAWAAPERRDASAPVPRPSGDTVVRGAFGRRKAVWGAAGVVLAAAAAVVLVVRLQPTWWTGGVDPKLADLVEAVGEERTVEARLTGGFKYGPLRSPMRSGGRVGPTDNWSLLAAAGRIREKAEREPTPENLHALGVASLLIDDRERAVLALEESLAQTPGSVALLNDLAAAYIARATLSDRPADLPQALEVLERVDVNTSSPESAFNRALVLELMQLTDDAIAAWNDYLARDSNSDWASEARTRRDALSARQVPQGAATVPMPQLPCLQHLKEVFDQGEMTKLGQLAPGCLNQARGDKARHWAAYFQAVANYYAGRLSAAEEIVKSLVAFPTDTSEPYLDSLVLHLLGGVQFARSAYEAGLISSAKASDLLTSIGNTDQLATVSQARAELHRALGQPNEAWRFYLRALNLGTTWRNPIRRHALFNSLGLASLSAGTPHVAARFLTAAERNATEARNPALLTEALLNRSRSFNSLGALSLAESDLAAASVSIDQVADASIRVRLLAELHAARSEVLGTRSPDEAIASAGLALRHYSTLGVQFRQAALQLTLARAHLAVANRPAARAALVSGVEILEGEQARLEERRLRISHLDRTWDIYRDLVEMAVHDGDIETALLVLERQKARLANSGRSELTIEGLRLALGEDTLVVVYLQTPTELLRWEVNSSSVQLSRTQVTADQILNWVLRFRARAMTGDAHAAPAELSAVLLDGLEAKLGAFNRVVIIPDGPIADIPFGALHIPGTPAFVAERVSTPISASIGQFLQADLARSYLNSGTRVVVVSPETAQEGLPALSWALHESQAIAALYPQSEVLSGAHATPHAMFAALQHADVVHFAGHAVADPMNPWQSRLLLSPENESVSGRWSPHAANGQRLRAFTVLAACSTAVGSHRRGAGPISLASEILALGAPGVVATLWDVPDAQAAQLFVRLHAALRRHARPSDAVRAIQADAGATTKWALVAIGW